MKKPRFTAALLPIVLILFCSVLHQAGASPSPATSAVQLVPFLTGLSSPVFLTNAKDGSNRIFVIERAGVIKVLQPGSPTPTVFLNITSKVLSGGEQGLLGLTFHPQFASNRRFFVNYTRQSDGATVIAEYRASVANPNVADTTETVILTIAQPFANHNGGMTEFGPDGFLYIGMGDGGGGNDTLRLAQNIDELLGKFLRIDINTPNGPVPYSSPATNPFFGSTPGRDEIYAVGMRNPWRYSFDRGTGQLYAGDVGQGAREEVDIITLGANYGWRVFEGFLCTNLEPLCGLGGFTPPIVDYGHTGGRCSITGGYVYRGPNGTLPAGSYVYADFCTGEIFLLQGTASSLLLVAGVNVSSFGEDEAGEIYVVGLGGTVHRLAASSTTCTFSILPSSQSFPVGGGTGSVAVSAQVGCAWTSMSNASWLVLTSSSGSGNGTASYSVAANPGPAGRSGTMTIAGHTFTVNQAGTPCAFSISPTSNSFPASGGGGTVTVSTTSTCSWTAFSLAPWIMVTSGASGLGNGMVAYAIAPNTERSGRTSSITIAGQPFTITQQAAPTSCVSSISPTSSGFPVGGGSAAVTVTAPSSCNWTTMSNDTWITIVSGGSGKGTATAKYMVAANSSTTARTGSISIGSQTLTVNQDASVCSFTLGAASQSFAAAGGTGGVSVTSPAGCGWSAVSNDAFITITSGASGSGSGTVGYSVSANSVAALRMGTISIAGNTFTVLQAGTGGTSCSFFISPTSQSFAFSGGAGSVSVTALAGCNWTAVSNDSFIMVTAGSSGTGNGTVSYSVAGNTGAGSRSGTITIAGQTFTVNQAGACAYSISPVNRLIPAAGGTATVSVTATAGCGWIATSNVGWITITSGASGSGNGTVIYSATPKPPGAGRTGTITIAGTIAGLTHTVKQ